ncbi:MAG: hypothetical protein D6754_05045 [Alphaproteobacteria bacterium]|nr:MAG: hypothetical protein D6754_05045 [Alphaproteobacteria bacterium]
MPVLHVSDVEAGAAAFAQSFGFAPAGFWRDEDGTARFSILRLGDVTLALQRAETVTPATGWAAYIYVDDVAALHELATAQGAPVTAPQDRFYGCREIEFTDPDGNVVCFAQDLDPGPEGPGL